MSNHCFSFLEEEFPDIASECESCEKHYVEGNYTESVFRAGKAAEFIAIFIAEDNGFQEFYNQKARLIALSRKNLFPTKIEVNFNKIRNSRNTAVHKKGDALKDYTYQMHRRLYEICVWFYEKYSHNDLVLSEYNGPIYKSEKINKKDLEGKIDNRVEEKVSEVEKNVTQAVDKRIEEILNKKLSQIENQKSEKIPEDNDNLKNYPFNSEGSSLLNELLKLNISSGEAVESENNLNKFKSYIHVDRSIQDDLIKELERVVDEKSSHLVMLCGSVGDGKSHLLAYIKTKHPDLYSKFTIHGDATESHYTQKKAEDTLAEVLSSFDDENIYKSNEKFILAINLGVLNNFLESNYCLERYTKLKEIIEQAHIFDSEIISQNIIQDKVSFITFSDYNLFELNGDVDSNYVSSNYISSLIKRITIKDYENNPFYRAYRMDKEKGYFSPIMINYEMLCDEEVQKVLSEYIIRIFVEYKKIISTRDLLNLIYELIVPPRIDEYSTDDNVSEFIDYLLPNMLFNNAERSDLLYLLSKYDPTAIRSKELDMFIMNFNISHNINEIFEEYFNSSKAESLNYYFVEYEDLFNCSDSEKQKLLITLIRFALFYGKSNFKLNFADKNYLKFLKYLYYYNIQNHSQYQNLFVDVKKAIFNLKGSIRKDYICIDELDSFKVSKELKLKYNPDSFDVTFEDKLSNRFKTSIKVYFSVLPGKNKIPLEVDFPLYSAICKLNKGYKPNKFEMENLILFDEFINNLINENKSDDLIINNLDLDVDFTFEYNEDFDSFTFERGG